MTCWDSGHIVRIARPLLTRMPILWPVYAWHSHGIETVQTLLESYDWFQKMKEGKPHARLSVRAALDLVPNLNPKGLVGALIFDEWWVDPLKLVDGNLESAQRYGANVMTGMDVDGFIQDGRAVRGVVAAGRRYKSRLVINAAGPWIGALADKLGVRIDLRLRRGTHLIYREKLLPVGLILETPGKGRYIFAIPFSEGTLVGPTDVDGGEHPSAIVSSGDELASLAQSAGFYIGNLPPCHESSIVGARPILGRGGNEKLLSREYEVFDHESRDGVKGFLTIGGGKMSDFRAMAQAATDAACARLGRSEPCVTHRETLSGEAVDSIPDFPRPSEFSRDFFRKHPRIRQGYSLAHLAAAFARHLALKYYRS
ncbi:MAG: FAD-dependent oxidoreductase [Elusimicrobiota bacterium]